ncbi:MAG TPA: dTMP kinase [Pseudomonadota bacterium]|nr:dTMP kinase [Pseudomonadota bacterium]HQY35358.1 dTMP kinase [Pseudomonadota bacterium]HRA36512.1 dTMP kinase [Pseudomonadota bacterium]
MSRRGLFISFEGGEGAGKSTVMTAAGSLLAQAGLSHRVTREPGGCPLAEALRALVLDPRHAGTCREAEVLMMFAARAQHVVETIEPALAAGHWVVSDRFTDASFAYQGGGRGIPAAILEQLEGWAAFGLRPDRTFLLDVPVAEGLRRIAGRGEADRMERESAAFFERVRAAYLARAQAEPHRFRVIDATRPLEAVVAAVESELQALVRDWRAGAGS